MRTVVRCAGMVRLQDASAGTPGLMKLRDNRAAHDDPVGVRSERLGLLGRGNSKADRDGRFRRRSGRRQLTR